MNIKKSRYLCIGFQEKTSIFFINLLLVASCCDSTRPFSFTDAKLANLFLPANICVKFNSVKN